MHSNRNTTAIDYSGKDHDDWSVGKSRPLSAFLNTTTSFWNCLECQPTSFWRNSKTWDSEVCCHHLIINKSFWGVFSSGPSLARRRGRCLRGTTIPPTRTALLYLVFELCCKQDCHILGEILQKVPIPYFVKIGWWTNKLSLHSPSPTRTEYKAMS